MRTLLLSILCTLSSVILAQTSLPSIHTLDAVTITGDTISMSQYAGKKLMIVNTASYCGYTPQFADLQQLYALYHTSDNFEIIGFPCNDFNGQDPLTDSASLAFCTSNYNVTFQMMSHVHINTGSISPIYQWLKSQALNGVSNATVTWNFNKFLIDEAGHWINHYTQATNPSAQAIVDWITTPTVYTAVTTASDSKHQIVLQNFADYISISELGANATIELMRIDGKRISLEQVQSSTYDISTSQLSKGIYVLKVNRGNNYDVVKFVVN